MNESSTFVILFCIASGIAITVRRVSIPYTIALVAAGLVVGGMHWLESAHLTKELLFSVFLPGLLFEAAFRLPAKELRANAYGILALALPGVVAAIAITAAVIATVGRVTGTPALTWEFGLVLGALLAATDPVSVVAMFRRLRVPQRLTVLVEAESLLNDGTSIVFLTLVLTYVGGASLSTASVISSLAFVTLGGAVVGLGVGVAVSLLTKRVDDAMIEITLTVISAYGSFALAEGLHVSGVIATVAAGIVVGNYGRQTGMSAGTEAAVHAFWDYLAFALNSVVFLLIGRAAVLSSLLASAWEISAAFIAVIAARFAVVACVCWLLRGTNERFPNRWPLIVSWGGLRGALSMVLALSLPETLPSRDLLITITFGVVLISIMLQGLTMPRVLGHVRRSADASASVPA